HPRHDHPARVRRRRHHIRRTPVRRGTAHGRRTGQGSRPGHAPPPGRLHAVPHEGPLPPSRGPQIPRTSPVLAPSPPHGPTAVQRQRRRGGGLAAPRTPADDLRQRVHADHLGRGHDRHRPGTGHGRLRRLSHPGRRQRHLPTPRLTHGLPGAGPARRGQRRGTRILRRCTCRQDPRPRGHRDRTLHPRRPPPTRRTHPGRPHALHVRPVHGSPAQPRCTRSTPHRHVAPVHRSHRRR